MAIKNLFGRGIGHGVTHWIVTRGFGATSVVPPVVAQPGGGGRRIPWSEITGKKKKKRTLYEPLSDEDINGIYPPAAPWLPDWVVLALADEDDEDD